MVCTSARMLDKDDLPYISPTSPLDLTGRLGMVCTRSAMVKRAGCETVLPSCALASETYSSFLLLTTTNLL